MDKKRTFHHSKADDGEEKKDAPKVEDVEEKDPLDDDDEPAEAEEAPVRSHSAESETEEPKGGPKINFDYPHSQAESQVAEPSAPATSSNLDDLAGDEIVEPPSKYNNPYTEEEPATGADIPHLQPNNPNSPLAQNPASGRMAPGAGMGTSFSGYGQNNNFQFRRENNFKSNRSSKVYFFLLIAIGLVVLGGAVYLLKHQLKVAAPSPSPVPEVKITTPSPSPTAAPLDRSKFTISVLNGSGKTGLAATVADKLKTLGYKIDKTANATNSAFPRTIVRIKPDGQNLATQLIKDLSDQQFDATSQASLKSSDSIDSEVILGAK